MYPCPMDLLVSQCNDKCDLTQETRTAHCATQEGNVHPDEKCDSDKRPELTRECEDVQNCEYRWYASQWSEVTVEIPIEGFSMTSKVALQIFSIVLVLGQMR